MQLCMKKYQKKFRYFRVNGKSSTNIQSECRLKKWSECRLKKQSEADDKDDNWINDGTVSEKYGMDVLYTEDSEDQGYLFGKILANVSSDGDYLERQTIPFQQMKDVETKIHSILGNDVPVDLHLGTRPS